MELRGTFNCSGKVNSNDWQLNKSSLFVQHEINSMVFTSQESPSFLGHVVLFGSVMPSSTAALNLKHLTACIEMKLKLFGRCKKSEILNARKEDQPDFFSARKNVCDALVYIRSYFYSIKWNTTLIKNVENLIGENFAELLLVLKKYIRELRNINDSIFHYAGSNLAVEHVLPQFHMYHLHLELRWLWLTLMDAKGCPENSSTLDDLMNDNTCSLGSMSIPYHNPDLEVAITTVVDDLIYVATKLFARIALETKHQNLKIKTPYSCTCTRELWLMLQIFIDDMAVKRGSKTFWDYVNIGLDIRLGPTTAATTSVSWNMIPEEHFLECKNPEMFSIWLIYHLTLLYGYNLDGVYTGIASTRIHPNHVQVEKILKVYLNKGGKAGERDEIDEELQEMIPLLTVLTCEWWQPRVQIISLLWDCFHRRLDQPFLLQATGPWFVSVDKKGPRDILKQVKQRLDNNTCTSSYGMFLRLLGIFLRKTRVDIDSKCWNQLKGRIYSKFTKSKVEEFSVAGLYNFISLFVTLALTTNTSEVCTMMLDLLPSVLTENRDQQSRIIAWKGELVVFLLFAEQKISFEKICGRFLKEVDEISCRKDETSRFMLYAFVDVLDEILTSSERMELSEHSFIGGWIDRYFLESPRAKVKTLITVLINVLNKCIELRSSSHETISAQSGIRPMLEALWKHVASRVRTLVFDMQIYGDDYHILSELAVRFTVEALKEPETAARHQHKFVSLFKHFVSSPMIKDVRIIRSYLTLILQDEYAVRELRKEIKNFDTIVIQAWIKCCVMKSDTENTDLKNLTLYLIKTDEMAQIFQSNSELIAAATSKEPIILFIKTIMKRQQSLQTEQERLWIAGKCREYFAQIDKWASQLITEETKESELTYWIYRCIGTLIFYCGPMLYVKSQPNNLLVALIKKFVLPPDKPLYIMNIGKRIFSWIILGIGNLNVRGDLSLQSLIKNLFEAYLPHLITDTCKTGSYKISEKLSNIFHDNNVDYLRLILDKLAVNFIVCRDVVTHDHCYLVMLLLRNLINSGKLYGPHIIDTIISVCLPHVITCYMKVRDLHTHRQQTIDLISDIVSNPYYRENPKKREEIKLIIINTVQKYITTSPNIFFEFITSVCDLIPEVKVFIYSKIERTIAELEANRYPHVSNLRFSLNRVKARTKPLVEDFDMIKHK
ncbi:protein MMS22-like [Diprion similis]|uniref:protein MMS22-like n=1 Tax=Diprion similis TaxID=362088 RepID=UPI001EF8FB38|nr:protein MMS22-like [Diprion similis]XP_046741978.1 protein MMS22-like [Diprion similis]